MPRKAAPGYNVLAPNLGLYYDRPPEAVPPGGLVDGNNFRIKFGRINAYNMGRSLFLASPLNGPVALISNFFLSSGTQLLVLGTLTDLYNYNAGNPVFITPAYTTGTIAVTSGGAVTGTGTAWNTATATGFRKNVQAGDYIYIGSATQNSPSATWWKVQSVASDTSLQLANYTGGAVAAGAAYTARQCFTGTLDNPWQVEVFPNAAPSLGDQWIATNGVDAVVSWNGQATFATLQIGLGFTCTYLYRYKDMLLYMNLTMASGTFNPTSFTNSDAGQPFVINSGTAGTYLVSDGDTPILSAGRLYDNLVIYCGGLPQQQREIVIASFVGAPLNWIFRTVVMGRGPLAANLFADFGYFHKFLGPEGQFLFNGIGLEVSGPQVFRQVMQSFDPSRINRAWTHFDLQNGDLLWAIPLTSDTHGFGPETAYVEHYLEDNEPGGQPPFSKRDMVTTAQGYFQRQSTLTFASLTNGFDTYNFPWNANFFQSGFPYDLVGDGTGNVYTLNTADTNNGTGYASFVTFPPKVIGDLRAKGLVRRVYVYAEQLPGATYSLTVTTTVRDRVAGAALSHVINTYDLTQAGQRFVNPFAVGRTAQVQFGTSGSSTGQPWILDGYDLDVVPGGQR